MDFESLKEQCEFEMHIDSDIVLWLIEQAENSYQEGYKKGQHDKWREIFDSLYNKD